MQPFTVVAVDHRYSSVQLEREVVEKAGGRFIDADALAPAEAHRAYAAADAILVRWMRVTAEVMKQFPRCKIIVRYGVGTDNVDPDAATAAGIMVGHVPYYCTDEVSNHAIALWLASVRHVAFIHQNITNGVWDANPQATMWRSAGRTFGLIGLGNIGQAVARKLAGWRMTLLATDPYVDPAKAAALGVKLVSLTDLLRQSDYVSLHVPLLPETRHLITTQQFALMKPSAILVNTARGPVVDNVALLEALDSGKLAQAALDVCDPEPPALDSPLRRHPRIILSDHVAWYSEESQIELRVTAAEEAVRVASGGLPRSLANPEVLEKLGRWNEWTPNDTVRWQLRRKAALATLQTC